MQRWLQTVRRAVASHSQHPPQSPPTPIAIDAGGAGMIASLSAFSFDDIRPTDSVSQDSYSSNSMAHESPIEDTDMALDSTDSGPPSMPAIWDDAGEEQDELEDDVAAEPEPSVVTCDTFTSSSKHRRTAGIAKRLFSQATIRKANGSTVQKWLCHLCRDAGQEYTCGVQDTTSSMCLKHLKTKHKDNDDVIDAYPELVDKSVGAHASPVPSQTTLTAAYSKEVLLEHLVCLIAMDNLAIRIVESPQLRALVNLLSRPAFRDMPSDSAMGDVITTVFLNVRSYSTVCSAY